MIVAEPWVVWRGQFQGRTRYLRSPASPDAQEGLNRWVGLFAAASKRAVADADAFEERIQHLESTWHERLGRLRANSAADLVPRALPGSSILTVPSAIELIGRNIQAANKANSRPTDAGVLSQTTVGRRNRVFEAPKLIHALTDLERRPASPSGDTRTAPHTRRVPRRH
jgi:hypothetical protein